MKHMSILAEDSIRFLEGVVEVSKMFEDTERKDKIHFAIFEWIWVRFEIEIVSFNASFFCDLETFFIYINSVDRTTVKNISERPTQSTVADSKLEDCINFSSVFG